MGSSVFFSLAQIRTALFGAVWSMVNTIKQMQSAENTRVFVRIADSTTHLSAHVPLKLLSRLTVHDVFEAIERKLSSSESMDLETTEFAFSTYNGLRGGGGKRKTREYFSFEEMMKGLRVNIYDIDPKFNECFGIALFLGLSSLRDIPAGEWNPWSRTKPVKLQREGSALMLSQEHRLQGVPLEDIHLYESKYRVNVRIVKYPGQRELPRTPAPLNEVSFKALPRKLKVFRVKKDPVLIFGCCLFPIFPDQELLSAIFMRSRRTPSTGSSTVTQNSVGIATKVFKQSATIASPCV